MKYALFAALAVGLATPAFAEEPAPAGGMDMSKMGPWSRKPGNEKQIRKEIGEFFKLQAELEKKGDFDADVGLHDFPIMMLTDDAAGVPSGDLWDRARYVKEMKPFWENMPKDMKTTHKPNVVILSDSLVAITDEFKTTMGKTKVGGRNAAILVKRDGKWLWKVMVEAGWGTPPAATVATPETKTEAKPETKTPPAKGK